MTESKGPRTKLKVLGPLVHSTVLCANSEQKWVLAQRRKTKIMQIMNRFKASLTHRTEHANKKGGLNRSILREKV